MVPEREIFWNIQLGEIVYVLGVIVTVILIYAIYRHYKSWRRGKPEDRSSRIGRRIWAFIKTGLVDGIFHRKFFGIVDNLGHRTLTAKDLQPREFYPGLAHYLIFGGAIILLLASFLDFISHYFFHFLHGTVYLVVSLVTDIGGIAIIIGVIMAVIRRYVRKPKRLENKTENLVVLLLILVVVISGFLVEGLRIAADELKANPDWSPWSPGGFVLAKMFSGLSDGALVTWHRIIWWFHMLISMGAIAYVSLCWIALRHVIVSPINVFFRTLDGKALPLREQFVKGNTYGVAKIEEFTWKQLLDLDACTNCGRCQDACPAYFTGKPLSPRKVIQDLKNKFFERPSELTAAQSTATSNPGPGTTATLAGSAVTEDEIWACTTCGACMEVCPVFIEHVPKLIDLRRHLVEMRSKFPEELTGFFENIEQRSNPWGIAPADRVKWATQISVKPFEAGKTEYLFWVGCAGAFDARAKQVSVAISKILDAAGVSWGTLGRDENCCGDSLRRLGNEYVFDRLVQQNIKLFQDKGVKKIITECPHCYTTLKNDYRQYGAELEVIHHTELISNLIKENKLKLDRTATPPSLVFHDSCYLGRYNGIYEAPRQVIASVTGQAPIEMKRNYERAFCCGGGGGRMWMEESIGKRINSERVQEALEQNPSTICVSCPYCLTMFEDGLKEEKADDRVKVLDLAEIVARALK